MIGDEPEEEGEKLGEEAKEGELLEDDEGER